MTPAPVLMRLRLIGQMEAWTRTSEGVLPTGRKTRAVLAMLGLSMPRPVLRGRLAELLWSRRPDDQARASLRQEIYRLTETLGPAASQAVVVTRDHMALRPGAVWVDVHEVLRATAANPVALSLLDGELLEDLDGVDAAFDAWVASERELLRDRARALAETLLRDQTEPEAAIAAAHRLLAIDRAHEGAWRALMRSYAAQGERGLAIQAYQRCRAVLAYKLDAQPSEETTRLMAELRASGTPRAAQASAAEGDALGTPHVDERSGPRVGIMPLHLIGTAELETQFGAGLAEEITAALARFRCMSVISPRSLARFAAEGRDETAIRQTFDVDFLLDGTIQRAQRRLRVAMRLLDLRAGNRVVWSHRFERQGDDLLALQDEIAAETAAQVDAEIWMVGAPRTTARPGRAASAYDLLLRGLGMMGPLERPAFMQAGTLLHQATERAPNYPAAHAWYAWWHILLLAQGWATDQQATIAGTGRLAERAVALDPLNAKGLAIAGHVGAALHRRPREAMALYERALLLNPHLAMAWGLSGLAFASMGDLEESERRLRHCRKLSPLDPCAAFFNAGLCVAALLRKDHSTAVSIGRSTCEMQPAFAGACTPYLAALGHLGMADEAARVRARLLAIESGFTLSRFLALHSFERAEHRDHYAEGLRRAGVAE